MKKIFTTLLIVLAAMNIGFANPKASYISTQCSISEGQLIFSDLRKTSISDIDEYVTSAFFKTTIVQELDDLPILHSNDLDWFYGFYSNDVILAKTTPSGDILYLKQGNCVRIFYVYFDTKIKREKLKYA